MERMLDKVIKKVNLAIMGVAMCCMFTMGLSFGLQNNASANDVAVNSEEVLLQKDAVIKEVVQYEEGLNPFIATSKSTQLANLSLEKLEAFADSGYVVYIVGTQTNENLPEPVRIQEEDKKIVVSTHSNDGALVDVVNTVLAQK